VSLLQSVWRLFEQTKPKLRGFPWHFLALVYFGTVARECSGQSWHS